VRRGWVHCICTSSGCRLEWDQDGRHACVCRDCGAPGRQVRAVPTALAPKPVVVVAPRPSAYIPAKAAPAVRAIVQPRKTLVGPKSLLQILLGA
jgi:hypothetical protein